MVRTSVIIFFIGSLFSSCTKDPMLWEISNLNNNEIGIVGHGGMGIYGKEPLSSEPSLQKAIDMGADAVEMDVQMSLDSVLFVFHDQDLASSTACSGQIHSLNSPDINCRYKGLFNKKEIEVLTLTETLKQLQVSDAHFFVFDCKTPGDVSEEWLEKFANALLKQIEQVGYIHRCFIESTDTRFLALLRKKEPRARLFIYLQDFDQAFAVANEHRLYGITIDMHRVRKSHLEKAHKAGLRVALYNQKTEKDNLDAIEMNADYIQTDKLKHVLKIFEKYKN